MNTNQKKILNFTGVTKGLGLVLIINYLESLILLLFSLMVMTSDFTLGLIEMAISIFLFIIIFLVQLNKNIARYLLILLLIVEFFVFMTFFNILTVIIPAICVYVLTLDKTTIDQFEKKKSVV